MKRSLLISILLTLFCSCVNEDKLIDSICRNYITHVLPGGATAVMQSRTPIKWDSNSYCYKTDVDYTFSTKYGYSGIATMTIGLDSSKKKVKLYSNPNVKAISDCNLEYGVCHSTVKRAFYEEKAVLTIMIPERYSVSQLDSISQHAYYKYGHTSKSCQISFYLKGMSLQGPNYAIAKVNNCEYVFIPSIEINPITEVTEPESLSIETQKKNPASPFKNAEIIGNYQFIGNSTITVYKQGGKYYMVTFADGAYQKPDALVNLGGHKFRYVEDTGEIFKAQADGLYCYFEGNLGAVYHAI